MNYEEEVSKRLLKIKEISKRAADDKDLKNFKKEVFEENGSTPKFTNKRFFSSPLHLVQNPNEDSFAFWKLLRDGYAKEIKLPR